MKLRRTAFAVGAARLGRPELVHREREHIGRAFLAHPPDVQLGHGRLVDEQHGQLGQRVHPHLVENVPGQPGESCLVDLDSRLVGYLDAHAGSRKDRPGR